MDEEPSGERSARAAASRTVAPGYVSCDREAGGPGAEKSGSDFCVAFQIRAGRSNVLKLAASS